MSASRRRFVRNNQTTNPSPMTISGMFADSGDHLPEELPARKILGPGEHRLVEREDDLARERHGQGDESGETQESDDEPGDIAV